MDHEPDEEPVSTGASTRQPTAIEVFAVVTRADGTVQPLGLISARYGWRRPLRKITWPIRRRMANRRIKKANKASIT